jgi:PKHD-type hydroxylase
MSVMSQTESDLLDMIEPDDLHSNSISPIRLVGAFTNDECDVINALGLASTRTHGRMHVPIEGYRESMISRLRPSLDERWLVEKLLSIASGINKQYGFDLTEGAIDLQYTQYEIGGKLGWHSDYDFNSVRPRKISLSLQLSPPADYDGGGLEFYPSGELPLSRLQGTAIAFPSFSTHRVETLTRGMRAALVVWFLGPKFR